MMKTVMKIPDFSVELINNQTRMTRLIDRLAAPSVIALDIETVNWWNRHQERIALVQIAFRTAKQPKVAVIRIAASASGTGDEDESYSQRGL
jgi:hypothetical protein